LFARVFHIARKGHERRSGRGYGQHDHQVAVAVKYRWLPQSTIGGSELLM
jgi:hypothetical protein